MRDRSKVGPPSHEQGADSVDGSQRGEYIPPRGCFAHREGAGRKAGEAPGASESGIRTVLKTMRLAPRVWKTFQPGVKIAAVTDDRAQGLSREAPFAQPGPQGAIRKGQAHRVGGDGISPHEDRVRQGADLERGAFYREEK